MRINDYFFMDSVMNLPEVDEIYLSVLMLSNNLSENWLKARLMTISF